MTETWQESQHHEAEFWGACANTYGEETKQLKYMQLLGIEPYHDGNSPFNFHGDGLRILDIGGGPSSVLLKFTGCARRVVADPCDYPRWVDERYAAAGVEFERVAGEDVAHVGEFDLALIYNVLQHTQDPARVVANARRAAARIKLFDWIDIQPHPGHPHCLTRELLDTWTGGHGQTVQLHGESECYGRAYVLR